MKSLFLSLITLSIGCSAYLPAHSREFSFPLDPLTFAEQQEALAAVRADYKKSHSKDIHNLIYDRVELKEPPKQEVLAFKDQYGPLPARQATISIYDPTLDLYLEYLYDFGTGLHVIPKKKDLTKKEHKAFQNGKILLKGKTPNARPAYNSIEEQKVLNSAINHPLFLAACQRRGISKEEAHNHISFALHLSQNADTRTYTCIPYWDDAAPSASFYQQPINQIVVTVDMSSALPKVTVTDTVLQEEEILPVNQGTICTSVNNGEAYSCFAEKELTAKKPAALLPHTSLHSYVRTGHLIEWENWKFHYTLHPRQGIVLSCVNYKNRPVLYRASTASLATLSLDKYVPTSNLQGEYNTRLFYSPLQLGLDVPADAELVPAIFTDENGVTYSLLDALAIYEQDGGLHSRHYDAKLQKHFGCRNRQLVLTHSTTIKNADYAFYWIFNSDGSLNVEVKMSGQPDCRQTAFATADDSVNLIQPYGHGITSSQFITYYLDFDIAGTTNRVLEQEYNSSWQVEKRPVGYAEGRDANPETSRHWVIENSLPDMKTALGFSPGYSLIPYTSSKLPQALLPPQLMHHLYVTTYDEESHDLKWHLNNIRNSDDLVVWYTVNAVIEPQPEDIPFMPVKTVGFSLKPHRFFTETPQILR